MLVKTLIENFDSFLFQNISTEEDVNTRLECTLLLMAVTVWLHIYPFMVKIDVISSEQWKTNKRHAIHAEMMTFNHHF